MHSIPVPKGTYVFIAIQAANVNPDLWGADAHEWRPERWLAPLPETVAEAKIPGVYSNLYVGLIPDRRQRRVASADNAVFWMYRMTFWGGGRSCM